MNCYRCNSGEGLSIKARHRDGRIRLMICRTCRRELHRIAKKPEKPIVPKNEREIWLDRAKKSHLAIINKYS